MYPPLFPLAPNRLVVSYHAILNEIMSQVSDFAPALEGIG